MTWAKAIKHTQNIVRKPENIFLVIALVFGIYFVNTIPSLWGIDEIEHFSRAYQVSELKMGVYKVDSGYGGDIPKDLSRLGQYAKGNLVDIHNSDKIWLRNDYNRHLPYKQLKSRPIRQPKEKVIFSNTAAYSPVGYFPSAFGIGVSRILNLNIGNTIIVARTIGLLAWIAIIYFAIRMLDRKEKWLIVVIALLPMTLFQASIVSNDTVINAVSLFIFALMIRAFRTYINKKQLSKDLIWAIGLSLATLSLAKPNYAPLGFIFILLPTALFMNRTSALKARAVWAAATLLPTLMWATISRPVADTIGQFRGSDVARMVIPHQQIVNSIQHPLIFPLACIRTVIIFGDTITQNVVGILGWNYVGMPLTAVSFAYVILVLCALNINYFKIKPQYSLLIALTIAAVVAGIFLTLYITFNTIGNTFVLGVQGRYFIPLLPFVLFLLGQYSPVKVNMSNRSQYVIFTLSSVTLLLIGAGYFTVATY